MANGILDKQLPNSVLGLKGSTPAKRKGAVQTDDIHFEGGTSKVHQEGHTGLQLGGLPTKYYDNLPE